MQEIRVIAVFKFERKKAQQVLFWMTFKMRHFSSHTCDVTQRTFLHTENEANMEGKGFSFISLYSFILHRLIEERHSAEETQAYRHSGYKEKPFV